MCPDGFVAYDGDTWGDGLSGYDMYSATLDKCATDCNGHRKCKSFIHSLSTLKCKLMEGESPKNPKWLDYQFCGKGKQYGNSNILGGNLSIYLI